eukprot:4005020-Pyramimonas_sp.AAC.1
MGPRSAVLSGGTHVDGGTGDGRKEGEEEEERRGGGTRGPSVQNEDPTPQDGWEKEIERERERERDRDRERDTN